MNYYSYLVYIILQNDAIQSENNCQLIVCFLKIHRTFNAFSAMMVLFWDRSR